MLLLEEGIVQNYLRMMGCYLLVFFLSMVKLEEPEPAFFSGFIWCASNGEEARMFNSKFRRLLSEACCGLDVVSIDNVIEFESGNQKRM